MLPAVVPLKRPFVRFAAHINLHRFVDLVKPTQSQKAIEIVASLLTTIIWTQRMFSYPSFLFKTVKRSANQPSEGVS